MMKTNLAEKVQIFDFYHRSEIIYENELIKSEEEEGKKEEDIEYVTSEVHLKLQEL